MFTYSLGGKGGGPGWATMLIDFFGGGGGGGQINFWPPLFVSRKKHQQICKIHLKHTE